MSLQSDQINELMTALAKAQGEMTHASKDSENPHFRSRFADLASVWKACREPLSKNGLAVTQTLDFAGERQVLITQLGHSSGQWIKSIIVLPQSNKPQETGSLLSYFRRYSLAAMVGVFQDDDDGEAATKPYRVDGINKAQVAALEEYFKVFPEALKGIYEKFNIKDIADLPPDQYSYVLNILKKRMAAKEIANKAE